MLLRTEVTHATDLDLLTVLIADRRKAELAATHERTTGAIRARLLKYGRINA